MGTSKGGGETVFEQVADGLSAKGHKVDRLYCDYDVPVGKIKEDQRGRHAAVSVPPTWKSFFRPTYAYRFLMSLMVLFRVLYHVRPDVVNQHFFQSTALHFVLLKPFFNYRFILSCHGSDVTNIRGFKKRVAPFILSRTDEVTCVSDDLTRKLRTQVPGSYSTKTIYNGIDVSFWKNGREHTPVKKSHFVSVGALKPVKGHDVLIRAFRKVVDECPEATLRIVGDGPEREAYQTLIRNLDLESHIELSGWLEPTGVRRALHEAEVFVHPSRREGFGLAVVEAMAAGCLIVASRVGGIPEVIEGTNACLVEPDSVRALSRAMTDSLDKKWREAKDVEVFRDRAQKFSWQQAIDKYEKVTKY